MRHFGACIIPIAKLDARDAALQRGEEDRRRALEAAERAERRARRAEDALAARG